jgi:hyaluronan synthase
MQDLLFFKPEPSLPIIHHFPFKLKQLNPLQYNHFFKIKSRVHKWHISCSERRGTFCERFTTAVQAKKTPSRKPMALIYKSLDEKEMKFSEPIPEIRVLPTKGGALQTISLGRDAVPLDDTSMTHPYGTTTFPDAPAKHDINPSISKTLILMGVILIIVLGLMQEAHGLSFLSSLWGKAFLITLKISMVIFTLALIWRLILLMKYHPVPPCPDEKLLTCAVLVPAYNEGRQVLETLRSIAQSDYPKEKLKIVVIDDGSKDDTWFWIQQAVREMPDRVTPIRLSSNRGKRHALHTGFRKCASEIFVTIDSDSQVQPQTIRCLTAPFVLDPKVGAVAGNVRILNQNEGLIPKMLEVSFAFSFDFLRAGQSVLNTVMCSPGALSAYRSKLVKKVLPQWINQKFLGRHANIGEDRAMTNMILKLGYHVLFQSNAMVFTKAPIRYRGLCKMFLRWARSNIRETLVMTRFVFTRFRKTPMLGARINLLLSLMALTLGQGIKLIIVGLFISMPEILGMRMLLGAVMAGILPALFYFYTYRDTDSLWAFAYSLFWVTGLWWITPYALLTPQKTGWLTRDLLPRKLPPHPIPFTPRTSGEPTVTFKKAA